MSRKDVVGGATSFGSLFGHPPELSATAHGRVNLIGEHTDYNDGFVMPALIPQQTRVDLAKRDDRRVRAWSREVSDSPAGMTEYQLGEEAPRRGWIDFVQGVTKLLCASGMPIGGFDVRVQSSIPPGAGLGSSAALEIALLRALRSAYSLSLSDQALAKLGQRVETEFVGVPIGIMDQLAAVAGEIGQALLIDTRTLHHRSVALPDTIDLVVIDSGVSHQHSKSGYRARREECERAAGLLGVAKLRDLDLDALERVMELPDPLGKRARHVITENDRVLRAFEAMRREDIVALGTQLHASHRSMRDDYEISTPEIDLLVELAQGEEAVLGARLTGGGFGGSMIMLTHLGAGLKVAERVAGAYRAQCGRTATVLVPMPRDPARISG